MPNEMNPSDPRNLWQGQEVEKVILTVDEVRSRAARFERRIHRRNVGEYLVGALMIALFTHQLWRTHGWRATPAVLIIVGIIYVMFQLHRRARARPLPADVGIRRSIEFHRVELERQRDAARAAWHWYLLPFVPGLAAGLAVTGIDHGINATLIRVGVVLVLVFVGIWVLNKRGARRLDRKIQELKAMETDPE
jgi:RsiW-degrading membrane proteinase PrsW (M82 family)